MEKIKNLNQFKSLFYLYLCDFEDINNKKLEKALKEYLMYHGVNIGKYKESDLTLNGFMLVGTENCRDLDELILHFRKYGDL